MVWMQPVHVNLVVWCRVKPSKARRNATRMREWKAEYANRTKSAPAPPEDTCINQEEEARDACPPPPSAASPPQASSPETDGVLAEENLTLKRKLRHAVTVANGCARVLEDERAENSEKIRRLSWALRLERDAHQKKKDNPLGHPLLPTHAEIQERLAE